jgi:hypothetical protein
MTRSSQTSTRAPGRSVGSAYSRPVRSWIRRRSPGGASVSEVTARPAKTSSLEEEAACPARHAAFFSGEQPQWAESGLPPQLPASRLPLTITPTAIRPIRRANARMVTRTVASTRRDLAASPKNANVAPNCVTNTGRDGDSRQDSSLRSESTQRIGSLLFLGRLPNLYARVTGSSLAKFRATRTPNRYGEVIVDSRSLARGLVMGGPSTHRT